MGAGWKLATVALVAGWWLVQVLPGGRPARLISTDLRVWYHPVHEVFWGRVAGGELPVWNPYHLGGLPWLARLAGGFFYPPHVLYLVLPTRMALAVLGLSHLVLAALGIGFLVRKAGGTGAAAALAAVLFTLRGTAPEWLFQPLLLEAVAWLPIGCVAVVGIVRGEGSRTVALLALATGASLLTGGLQVTAFLLYAWTALLVAALLAGGVPMVPLAAVPTRFVAALVLGALAAAVQLLPTAELTMLGTRQAHNLALESMFPFGFPGFGLVERSITGPAPSFGVIGLVLAPIGALAGRPRWLAIWALALVAFGFAIALGPVTPLFAVYPALPFLGWFRSPQRIFVLADFGMALLGALGFDVLARTEQPSRQRALLGALACALALIGSQTLQGATLPAGMAVAAAVVLVGARWWRAVVLVVLVLAALESLGAKPYFGPDYGRFPYDRDAAGLYDTHRAAYARLAAAQGNDRVWVIGAATDPSLSPKLYGRFRVRGLDDYDSMNLHRQAEYFDYAMYRSLDPPTRTPFLGRVDPWPAHGGTSFLAANRRLLDLMAVRLVAISRTTLESPKGRAFVAEAGLEPRPALDADLALFENPHALPRAFAVYRERPAPPTAELLHRLSDPDFDPLRETYVEGGAETVLSPQAPARGEPAEFVTDEARVVELDVHLAAPGLVVLADTFYPGWRVTVDGRPAPVLAVNHLFRGVRAGPGRHRVRFEYRPQGVWIGAAVSIAAAIVIALLWRGRSRPAAAA